jgi:hypothetical protein
MTGAITVKDIVGFVSQMDADMKKMKEQQDAEFQLADAIENYEKVNGVKLNVTEQHG